MIPQPNDRLPDGRPIPFEVRVRHMIKRQLTRLWLHLCGWHWTVVAEELARRRVLAAEREAKRRAKIAAEAERWYAEHSPEAERR